MSYLQLEKSLFQRQIGRYRPAFNGKYLLLFSRGKNGVIYSFIALLSTYLVVIFHLSSHLNTSTFVSVIYGLWMTFLTITTGLFLSLTWLTEPGVVLNTDIHHLYVNDGRPHRDQPRWLQAFNKGLRGKGIETSSYQPTEPEHQQYTLQNRNRNRKKRQQPSSNLGTELVDVDFPVNNTASTTTTTTTTTTSTPTTPTLSSDNSGNLDRRLLLSTADGDEDTVRILLERGAQPNTTNAQHRSPLHLAGYRGYEDIVTLLLKRGAICGISDNFGLTELHYALVNGHDGTAEILINHGAWIDTNKEPDPDRDPNHNQNHQNQNQDLENNKNGKENNQEQKENKEKTNYNNHQNRKTSLNALRNIAIIATNSALSKHAALEQKQNNTETTNVETPNKKNKKNVSSLRQQTSSPGLTKSKSILSKDGTEMKRYYCHVCQHFKPVLAHHSETCEVCIDGFEQYCRFVSNAIGKRNYKYYILLLFTASLLSLSCVIPCVTIILNQAVISKSTNSNNNNNNNNNMNASSLHDYTWEAILAVWSLIISVPLCSLTAYHMTAIISGLPVSYVAYSRRPGGFRSSHNKDDDEEERGGGKVGINRLFHLLSTPVAPSESLESATVMTNVLEDSDSDDNDNIDDDEYVYQNNEFSETKTKSGKRRKVLKR